MRVVTKQNFIDPKIAERLGLGRRLEAFRLIDGLPYGHSPTEEASRTIGHTYRNCARERYDRVASEFGIETRDPFMDRRVAEFCIALPPEQKMSGGWPKRILRSVMKDRMPKEMRLRRSKEHLGWTFTLRLLETESEEMSADIDREKMALERVWSRDLFERMPLVNFELQDNKGAEFIDCWYLANWLRRTDLRHTDFNEAIGTVF